MGHTAGTDSVQHELDIVGNGRGVDHIAAIGQGVAENVHSSTPRGYRAHTLTPPALGVPWGVGVSPTPVLLGQRLAAHLGHTAQGHYAHTVHSSVHSTVTVGRCDVCGDATVVGVLTHSALALPAVGGGGGVGGTGHGGLQWCQVARRHHGVRCPAIRPARLVYEIAMSPTELGGVGRRRPPHPVERDIVGERRGGEGGTVSQIIYLAIHRQPNHSPDSHK